MLRNIEMLMLVATYNHVFSLPVCVVSTSILKPLRVNSSTPVLYYHGRTDLVSIVIVNTVVSKDLTPFNTAAVEVKGV